MKAKVKATGKVVEATLNINISPVCGGSAKAFYDCSDGNTYLDTDLDFINVYPDWQQVRIQAGIASMQGMLANNTIDETIIDLTKLSVEFADELVKELQKGMEV